jgi:hypothetical protein
MSKVVSNTKGLKSGDIVQYVFGPYNFTATVVNVTSTTKAQIKPHSNVDTTFNTSNIINTYRKYMCIKN